MKNLLTIFAMFCAISGAFGQQQEHAFLDAYAEKGAQEFFYKNSRASSGSYMYVAGASLNDEGNYDMLLTK